MHAQDRLFCEIAVQLNLLTREQVTRCMQAQQREEAGKNIATLAVQLGFMHHAAVENVMQQQQRLLERRREAREASRAQREAESRAAGSRPSQAHPPLKPPPTAAARVGRREPTPTSRWTQGEAPPENRLRGEGPLSSAADFLAPAQLELADMTRPAERQSSRPFSGDTTRPAEDSFSAPGFLDDAYEAAAAASFGPQRAARPTKSLERSPYPATLPPSGADPLRPPSSAPPPRVGPSPRPPPRSTLPPRSAPLPGTPEQRSPPFMAAAASAPLAPPPSSSRQLSEPTAPLPERPGRSISRPVPSVRDWRNPSRPPPPNTGIELETMPPMASLAPGRSTPLAQGAPRYVDRALELCLEAGGSDLQLCTGAAPCLRVDGQLQLLASEAPLTPTAAERIVAEVCGPDALLQLSVDGELRGSYELPERGVRARTHAFVSELGLNIALHLMPSKVLPVERLGLGHVFQGLRDATRGLCLCSGPAGSGKTSTLWSLAHALAAERALHIVSLEDPLELAWSGGFGLFEQREVGEHVASYADGIDWAVGQAADVIMVADLLAPGALGSALRALRSGCLVLGSVRASSSRKALSCAIQRAGDSARSELASGLRVLLHQRLIPRATGPGRVVAIEQLTGSPELAQLIRDDALAQLPAHIAAAKGGSGMVSLDDALEEHVRAANITRGAARAAARSSERFESV
ncbi:MAG: ATPase, T2SS/T4P/T4SS family [Polyangiales bacterium]